MKYIYFENVLNDLKRYWFRILLLIVLPALLLGGISFVIEDDAVRSTEEFAVYETSLRSWDQSIAEKETSLAELEIMQENLQCYIMSAQQ